jgi:hypothetical protein
VSLLHCELDSQRRLADAADLVERALEGDLALEAPRRPRFRLALTAGTGATAVDLADDDARRAHGLGKRAEPVVKVG